jgi:hypothetical protein
MYSSSAGLRGGRGDRSDDRAVAGCRVLVTSRLTAKLRIPTKPIETTPRVSTFGRCKRLQRGFIARPA